MVSKHLKVIVARMVGGERIVGRAGASLLTLIVCGIAGAQGLPTGVWAVDKDATGDNNGETWEDSFTTLTAALANPDLESGHQIWVADGTYSPGDDPSDTFSLQEGVSIYGGFSTGDEDDLSERNPDPETNGCVLTGDLDNSSDFAYHVVTATNIEFEGFDMIHLDGFTIKDGDADGSTDDTREGGGIYCVAGGDVRINNCIIEENHADFIGGGAGVVGLKSKI